MTKPSKRVLSKKRLCLFVGMVFQSVHESRKVHIYSHFYYATKHGRIKCPCMKKLLIFCMVAFLPMYGAHALLLCSGLTSPSLCSSWTSNTAVNYNRVYSCSGSTVSEFEVWGGCGPNIGIGNYNDPKEQTPSGVQPATNNAGPYCYCQLKSINGGVDLPGSPWWVFADSINFIIIGGCIHLCTYGCADLARGNSGFRSALFSAAGF
jgi:hypothetical protein